MGKRKYATAIPMKVKLKVFERDKRRCIYCHLIRRGQGGLGIEKNVVTLCRKCHEAFDDGDKREEMEQYITDYLEFIYGENWKKEDLIYNKKK